MPCSSSNVNWHFRGTYHLYWKHGLVHFQRTTQHCVPDDKLFITSTVSTSVFLHNVFLDSLHTYKIVNNQSISTCIIAGAEHALFLFSVMGLQNVNASHLEFCSICKRLKKHFSNNSCSLQDKKIMLMEELFQTTQMSCFIIYMQELVLNTITKV
jgi:hypothetical protein